MGEMLDVPALRIKIPLVVVILVMAQGTVLIATAKHSSADAEESSSLLDSGHFIGPGWLWIAFWVPHGGSADLRVFGHDMGPPFATGSQSTTFHSVGGGGRWKEQVRIATDDREIEREFKIVSTGWGDRLIGGTSVRGGPGTVHQLVWIAGNVSGWHYELTGNDGVRVEELATGNSSFLFQSEDFASPFAAEIYFGGPGARAQVHGVKAIELVGSSAGAYLALSPARVLGADAATQAVGQPWEDPNIRLEWTDPTAVKSECPCTWSPFGSMRRAESGPHRFDFSGFSAGDYQNDEIILTGVDFAGFRSPLWG